jgi:hypothetical protein
MKMRSKSLAVVLSIIAAVGIAIILEGGSQTQPATVAQGEHGIPAIRPYLQASEHNGATYTLDDAVSYVRNHVSHIMFKSGSLGPITVTRAAFLESQEVSVLTNGESMGVPAHTLLCYVEVRGTFQVSAPVGIHPPVQHTALFVFSAQTGDLIFESV